MPDFETLASVSQYGIAAVALIGLLWFSAKLLESYNKNTEAINRMSNVLDRSMERETVFQQELMRISKDTNRKVDDIHRKVV